MEIIDVILFLLVDGWWIFLLLGIIALIFFLKLNQEKKYNPKMDHYYIYDEDKDNIL